MELKLDALDNPKIVTEALKLVDTRFRALSFLPEIIVRLYKDGPSGYIRRKMESRMDNQGFGITLNTLFKLKGNKLFVAYTAIMFLFVNALSFIKLYRDMKCFLPTYLYLLVIIV